MSRADARIVVVDVATLLAPAASLIPRKVEISHRGGGSEGSLSARFSRHGRVTRCRSKWDDDGEAVGGGDAFVGPSGTLRHLPPGLTKDQERALLARLRLEEIQFEAAAALRPSLPSHSQSSEHRRERERSPSPPPVYDRDGKRINTREQRKRDRLARERQALIDEAGRLCPTGGFVPPPDVGGLAGRFSRRTMKVYVPEKEYPDHNFIGMIIGPRGSTQKRLERESGARVSIRGKGSVIREKPSVGGDRGGPTPDEEEPLHVVITAETEEQMNKAYNMVKPLLMPEMDQVKSNFKRAQLIRLAEDNGTLRAQWFNTTSVGAYDARVVCSLCGDRGHPTCDCQYKDKGLTPAAAKASRIESEFDAFMSEIGEKPAAPTSQPASALSAADAEKSYEEFMAAISEPAGEAAYRSQQAGVVVPLPPGQQPVAIQPQPPGLSMPPQPQQQPYGYPPMYATPGWR